MRTRFALCCLFSCALASWRGSAELIFNPYLSKEFRNRVFSLDTADNYCPQCHPPSPGWLALRIPQSNAAAYARVPPLIALTLDGSLDSALELHITLPIQKDLEAWHSDRAGSNVIYHANQLNINVPTNSWIRWHYSSGFVRFGRFSPVIGPSPNSLVLGSAPSFHDAIWWQQQFGPWRFDWLLSALNPYLLGTPTEPGAPPPEGSEAWQQRHLSVSNQRKRSYTEPSKNLLLHRLGYESSWGWIALIEQSLVGGKHLSWRELNPLMIWHNNYGDGYTKASTTLEIALRPDRRHLFYWQVDFEDIASPVGETYGEIFPSTLGVLAGWLATWSPAIHTRLDAVYTDPSFNNHRLPLQKMIMRQVYRSNFRSQNTENFADEYILDYPLGYRRGPDAVDLWFTLAYQPPQKTWNADLEIAWLRQGAQELWTPWDSAAVYSRALSGIVEQEWRCMARFSLEAFQIYWQSGIGVGHIVNENHIRGASQTRPVWAVSAQYRLSSGGANRRPEH